MAETLSWNLHGDDQLSSVLERLDRTLSAVARKFDATTNDAKRMGEALSNVHRSTSSAGSALESLSSRVDSLGSHMNQGLMSLKNMATGGLIALGYFAVQGVESLTKFTIGAAASMQTSAVSFTQMLGSAKKANDFLGQLQHFAVVTPFELADLQVYASRLLAVGVRANDIIPILRHVGDAAAATGTGSFGIERAVTALNNMKLAGDVNIIHLRELAFAGVPVFDALASRFKTTTGEVMKMVTAGKISVADVFRAVETGTGKSFAAINGMMDKQSATLEGKWSNLKDSAQQTFGKAFLPMLPMLGRVVDFVGSSIPKAIAGLKSMANEVTGVFKGSAVPGEVMRSLRELAGKIGPQLHKTWETVVQTIRNNREGLEKLGRLLTTVIIPFVGIVIVKLIEFGGWLTNVAINAAGRFTDAFSFAARHVITFLGWITDAAATAFGWVPGLGPKLRKSQEEFHTWAANVNAMLDSLDGKHVRVFVDASSNVSAAESAYRSGINISGDGSRDLAPKGHAAGGANAPGWMLTGEHGPEIWYSGTSGHTMTASATRTALGSGEVLGTLRVQYERPDGTVMREELLALRRRQGGRTLGFD